MATPFRIIKSDVNPAIKADPTIEYVSGGQLIATTAGANIRLLPPLVDEIEHRLGDKIWDRMANDPDVHAAVSFLILAALAEIADKVPAIAAVDEKDPRFEVAREVADFCERMTSRVPKVKQKLYALMEEGMTHGNKLAEHIGEYPETGVDAGRLTLKDIKIKSRKVYGFVVDDKLNEVGIAYTKPGFYSNSSPYFVSIDQILPRNKFVVFTPIPMNEDPRGRPYIRPAYEDWWMKKETRPEHLRFLLQYAVASLLCFLPPNPKDVEVINKDTGAVEVDPETQRPRTIPAALDMLNTAVNIRNAQAAVFQNGAWVEPLEVKGNGEAFHSSFSYYGKQITLAILKQELATRDAEHQTKGSTGNQRTVVDLVVVWLKGGIADVIRYDLWKPYVVENWGDEIADELLPYPNLGDIERRDWAQDSGAAAKLAPNLTDSQWLQVLGWLGINPPEEGELLPTRQKASPFGSADPNADPNADSSEDPNADPNAVAAGLRMLISRMEAMLSAEEKRARA